MGRNLHTIYEELTALELGPVMVMAREYAENIHTTLEQVMKNTDGYLFVLAVTLLLTVPIVRAIQTLLTLRARIIFPLLRMQTGPRCETMTTSARSMDAIICPQCAFLFERHIDSNHGTLTQTMEGL